ncbi:hypothetical protein Bb109J_c1840 [Bdellovibrio bacteriovorus]|uniref:hypothetical protein n=1 Tax=Bdellovibrio bacteriovorus TaxID=959 RepID=UPI00045BECE1|nr:hypothetical protein [Bdellovibrio bacteriovorus]AHZ84531.1 hypothetical protein EP01_06215 [Bdellovibrio bacteriovorus]BEV68420.1 hypothetical protein Bb109J_c1840 [Bdellovibrio bacteriovorus]
MKFKWKIALWIVIVAGLLLGLRYCYYGSLLGTCVYTEEIQAVPAQFSSAKVRLIRPAAVLRGIDKEYQCLAEMGAITNKIVEAKHASHYRYQIENLQTETVDAGSNLDFEIVKMIAVTKHGIKTLDSGSGPIEHLILKDQHGNLYEVATVSLGLNAGDEYLKAITSDGQEIILNPEAF